MIRKISFLVTLFAFTACATTHTHTANTNKNDVRLPAQAEAKTTPAAPKPKYGPEAILLSDSHEYIRRHNAPTYWAMSPYYIPQRTDHSCTTAAATMVINAARKGRSFTADDELVTEEGLLKKVKDDHWERNVGQSEGAHGLTLDELKAALTKALTAYDFKNFTVEAVHTSDQSKQTLAQLHNALTETDQSARTLIIANFVQGVYTGDAMEGHMAPVGAYDSYHHRVLIMDPDRKWYEPYWVSEKTFLAGMATEDKTSASYRGYLVIRLGK